MNRNPSVLKLLRKVKGESLACMRARVRKELEMDKYRVIRGLKFIDAENRFVH